MTSARGGIDVEALLKIVLVLVVVWLALDILGEIVGAFAALFGIAQPLIAVVVLVLLVLWLLDRI